MSDFKAKCTNFNFGWGSVGPHPNVRNPEKNAAWQYVRSRVSFTCGGSIALTFETLVLEILFWTCRYIFRIYKGLYIKVMGSRSHEWKRASVCPVCGNSAFDWKAVLFRVILFLFTTFMPTSCVHCHLYHVTLLHSAVYYTSSIRHPFVWHNVL